MNAQRLTIWAVGSVLLALGMIAALVQRQPGSKPTARPLLVLAAASLRKPLTLVADDYQRETGEVVELRFGASEALLNQVRSPSPANPADLFLPADESYLDTATTLDLIEHRTTFATMRVVLLVSPKRTLPLETWAQLLQTQDVSLADQSAAIGRLTRQRLLATGHWQELEPLVRGAATVSDSANAARIGAVDAAIVWDAVAKGLAGSRLVELPELAGIVAQVQVALLKQSSDAARANRFRNHLLDAEHGLRRFRDCHFQTTAGPR